jgi:hypothetical protein
VQIRIEIPSAAHEALARLAIRERRGARDQAAVLLIQALAARGLVSDDGLDLGGAKSPELASAEPR